MPTGKPVTSAFSKRVVDYYLSRPMTHQAVCDEFGISLPTVCKILSVNNVKQWPKFRLYSPDFDEGYFHEIDTQEKAYFLGLLATDGNIFTGYKSASHPPNINLTLQKQDAYILTEWKRQLHVNKNLTSDGRGCVQLSVFSREMASDLIRYGIAPRKTFSTIVPERLPLGMYRHFFRGVFDGDGSASFYARPHRKVHVKAVRMCGATESFLTDLVDLLSRQAGASQVKLYMEKENLWSFAYRSNDDLEKVIHYMYDEASIFLTRKKRICDLILDEIRKYRGN